MLLLYNVFLIFFAPLWVPWMLWRASKRKEKPDWAQRSGNYPFQLKPAKRVWLHAVSVGEVIASIPIINELIAEPKVSIVLSVTTSSGMKVAQEKLAGKVEQIVYFPIDVPRFALAALARVRPNVVAIMETELWMNFLWTAKKMGISTVLINGRISDRSFPRSMKLRWFYRALLHNLDIAAMQSTKDQERIQALGAKSTQVCGNSKFDEISVESEPDVERLRTEFELKPGEFVLVIGSTRSDMEEQFVLDAIASLPFENWRVIHAPRHLESAPQLAENARKRFGNVGLRSKKTRAKYMILDTFGELSNVYALANVAIVGGGFDTLGGQNILQPLAHNKPVIHGSNMQNFAEVTRLALENSASIQVQTPEELTTAITDLYKNPEKCTAMASAASELIAANRGASKRYADLIRELLDQRG